MSTRIQRRLLLILVAVSIAGLLSMHGLDPVVATLDPPTAAGHTADMNTESNHHGVLGLCLFIAVAAGLASARLNLSRTAASPSRLTHRVPSSEGPSVEAKRGPPLFYRLCVLRL
ncbi:MAG: hypothetical protein WD651_10990 [Acidimicrobiia bacterium]